MDQRDRWRRRKAQRKIGVNLPPPPSSSSPQAAGGRVRRVLVIAMIVTAVVIFYRVWTRSGDHDAPEPIARTTPREVEPDAPAEVEPGDSRPDDVHGHAAPKKPASKTEPDDFLSAFKSEKENDSNVSSNQELEKSFQALIDIKTQIEDLTAKWAAPGALSSDDDFTRAMMQGKRLREDFDHKAAALDKKLQEARAARPDDATLRWLAGEVLLMVGGDSAEVVARLKYALDHGVTRPRLAVSLASAQLGANQFANAYQGASAALERNTQDRYAWRTFVKVAFSNDRFDEIVKRLDLAFPAGLPEWARDYRRDAVDLRDQWAAEEKIRRAEASADDLPRVRFVIEHRRFARDSAGNALKTVESTGRGEVIVELFENEAPVTVANFIDLVGRKFYDGTLLHEAVPAGWVRGGDPNTKRDEPAEHGKGGPGYVIPDEFASPKARHNFRGSLGMFNFNRPGSAGSQFFFNLVPVPEMNGRITFFGRVIQGQDVLDRITPGQTYRPRGALGRPIPGDLLVRAEVIRKRPHEYKVVKEKP